MAADQRKPWVLPVFFGLLIALFWLVTDVMKPPEGAKVSTPVVEDSPPVAVTPEAGTTEVLSPTALAAP